MKELYFFRKNVRIKNRKVMGEEITKLIQEYFMKRRMEMLVNYWEMIACPNAIGVNGILG